jgi:hypothetical protein
MLPCSAVQLLIEKQEDEVSVEPITDCDTDRHARMDKTTTVFKTKSVILWRRSNVKKSSGRE